MSLTILLAQAGPGLGPEPAVEPSVRFTAEKGQIPDWDDLIPALGKASTQPTKQVVAKVELSPEGQWPALGPGPLQGEVGTEAVMLLALLNGGLSSGSLVAEGSWLARSLPNLSSSSTQEWH